MAKKRVAPGRRSLIALVLVGFVLVGSGVIARRVLGVKGQTEIRKAQEKRTGLDADRIRLEAEIRKASSRASLQPIAEQRLNMHIPTPDQQVILPRTAPRTVKTHHTPNDSL
jgi:cell division protein FtsL